MKKSDSFWRSLEFYTWRVVSRSPLSWPWVGVGIIALVFLTSALSGRNSVLGATTLNDVIEAAILRGDYTLAERLYQAEGDQVLGVESELEDKIYPERVIERRVADLETKLAVYPGNRAIYQALAALYAQLNNHIKASDYREKARILDPNN